MGTDLKIAKNVSTERKVAGPFESFDPVVDIGMVGVISKYLFITVYIILYIYIYIYIYG